MSEFIEIRPEEWNENPFTALSRRWALLTAEKDGRANPMTVSWGGVGVLWNKNVFTCYIRPQRFTKPMADAASRLTLCFFGEEARGILRYCGKESGRDGDKIAACGLHPISENGATYFEEADTVLIGRKLLTTDFREENFTDKTLIAKNYPTEDFHTAYICEIEKILIKK